MSIFFIAEAGVNHNGRLDLAERLVDIAAEAGADAVKFQTFKADETVVAGASTVAYQKRTTAQEDQFALLKALELSESDHRVLRTRCEARGIEFMSTAFDITSAHLFRDLGVQRLKVPSGELTNLPFLQALTGVGLRMILSTGMGTLKEVEAAVDTIAKAKGKPATDLSDDLAILHCTSAYPAPDEELNLRAIQTLATHFRLPVGYSDHSGGSLAAMLAIALGSTVYEKHFTLDRTMEGPDHAASMEPDELTALVASMRQASGMLGDGVKATQPCEQEARRLVRRSLVAAHDLPAGRVLTAQDIRILRPEGGLPPVDLNRAIGATLVTARAAGQPLRGEDLEGFA
jgi:N-acetylneuraminate synthase